MKNLQRPDFRQVDRAPTAVRPYPCPDGSTARLDLCVRPSSTPLHHADGQTAPGARWVQPCKVDGGWSPGVALASRTLAAARRRDARPPQAQRDLPRLSGVAGLRTFTVLSRKLQRAEGPRLSLMTQGQCRRSAGRWPAGATRRASPAKSGRPQARVEPAEYAASGARNTRKDRSRSAPGPVAAGWYQGRLR